MQSGNLGSEQKLFVPAGVSNRHVHLTDADIETLFGKGHTLTKTKDLSQPGQFACEEQVTLVGPKGRMENIRILGPARKQTQVELSLTDTFKVGIKAPVRLSGELDGTPGGKLVGPCGEIDIPNGVIVAARHLHLTAAEAEEFGLKNGDIVSVVKKGPRETIFGNVIVRCGEGHSLDLHIDTDEANAAGIVQGEKLELLK